MPSDREELRFGNYELRTLADGQPHLLGKGTFGSTYKGCHIYLGEEVAIKVINARYISDTNAKERFLREARVLHAIRHPNIARVLDFGEVSAGMYFVLEFCGGGSLKDLAERVGPVPPSDVFTIARQCASALGMAHRSNFIHRDIKPANIMLARPGPELDIKLIDFGLVKIMNPEGEGAAQFQTLHTQGLFTPYYASPEQIREETLDARTDLFSLGMSLLYLLVGGLPERGAGATIIASRLGPKSYDHLIPDQVPPSARQILSRLLAKERDERFASADELMQALDSLAGEFAIELPTIISSDLSPTQPLVGAHGGSDSGEGGVATESASPPIPTVAEMYEIGTRRIAHPLGSFCDARRCGSGESCALLFVDADHLLDAVRLGEINHAVARLVECVHPAIAAPRALETLRDATVIPFAPFFGMDLLSILKLRKSFRLADVVPIVRQIAEAIDHAEEHELGPLRVTLGEIFMRGKSGGEFAGTNEILAVMPVARWPEFQSTLLPGLVRLELSELIADSGATMQASADGEGRANVEFAALIYQFVSGRTPPFAARVSRSAYTAVSSISEASNRLLASTICGEIDQPCQTLLDRLVAEEGIGPSPARPTLPVTATQPGGLSATGTSRPVTGTGASRPLTATGSSSTSLPKPPGVLPTAPQPATSSGPVPPVSPSVRPATQRAPEVPAPESLRGSPKDPEAASETMVAGLDDSFPPPAPPAPKAAAPPPPPPAPPVRPPTISAPRRVDVPSIPSRAVPPPAASPPVAPRVDVPAAAPRPDVTLPPAATARAKEAPTADVPARGGRGLLVGVGALVIVGAIVGLVIFKRGQTKPAENPPTIAAATPAPVAPTLSPSIAPATAPVVARATPIPPPAAPPPVMVARDYFFSQGVRPAGARFTLNGRPVEARVSGNGMVVPLENAEPPVRIGVSAPGFVAAEVKPTSLESLRMDNRLDLVRATGTVHVAKSAPASDYDSLVLKMVQPLSDEARFVVLDPTEIDVPISGDGREFERRVPTGIYNVTVRAKANPKIAPLAIATAVPIEVRRETKLSVPPSWAGSFKYEYSPVGGVTIKREIVIQPGLRPAVVRDTPVIQGVQKPTVEYACDIVSLSDAGVLSGVIRVSLQDESIRYWDACFELRRDERNQLQVAWGWEASPERPEEASRIRAALKKRYPKGIPSPQTDRALAKTSPLERIP